MESLALAAAVIVLTIIVLGLLSLFTVLRTPKSGVGRVITLTINVMGTIAGGWLALLDIGVGARLIGVAVLAASVVSATRVLRGRAG
jgi:hypothetical protein